MAKIPGPKDNFRVVVYPRRMGDFGSVSVSNSLFYGNTKEGRKRYERDCQDRCEDIVSDIKRHTDNVGYCEIEYDQEEVCEHCGGTWTEESSIYNGGCCSKDEENNPEEEV